MEAGRYSTKYGQFLYNRFYRRYNDTCYVKVNCVVEGCKETVSIRANTPEPEKTFKCETCSSITRDTE
jgi:hypothetical protein